MSQNDYVIANQTAPNFRADLNLALQALASNSSGATAPATTYANMLWYDTAANTLYMRSEADDAWITLGTLDQSLNTFTPAGIATQTTAVWEAGTDTTESLVSAAKVAAAFVALSSSSNLAYDIQTFTASGTWTKPASALSTDIVYVHCVGGGGGGSKYNTTSGGGGGGGAYIQFSMADVTDASYPVAVGAGGLGRVPNTDGSGGGGGSTSFGTAGAASGGLYPVYVLARGGEAGQSSSDSDGGKVSWGTTRSPNSADKVGFSGGDGRNGVDGESSIFGGGGGGGSSSDGTGGFSAYAGKGGYGKYAATDISVIQSDGNFPGGGGGGVRTASSTVRAGNGSDGVCFVYCYRGLAG